MHFDFFSFIEKSHLFTRFHSVMILNAIKLVFVGVALFVLAVAIGQLKYSILHTADGAHVILSIETINAIASSTPDTVCTLSMRACNRAHNAHAYRILTICQYQNENGLALLRGPGKCPMDVERKELN